MDQHHFDVELVRIKAAIPKAWDGEDVESRAVLVRELWRKFGHLDGRTWQLTVDWVVDHHDRKDLRVRDFVDALESASRRQSKTISLPQQIPPTLTPIQKAEHLRWLEAEAIAMNPHQARRTLEFNKVGPVKLPADIARLLEEIAQAAPEDKKSGVLA